MYVCVYVYVRACVCVYVCVLVWWSVNSQVCFQLLFLVCICMPLLLASMAKPGLESSLLLKVPTYIHQPQAWAVVATVRAD